MRIAVTGGSGFLGRHVVRRLLAGGHDVVVLDVVAPSVAFHKDMQPEYRYEDLEDPMSIFQNIKDCDLVMHLAAVSNTNAAYQDPTRCLLVNSLGTHNVYEAVTKTYSVRRVVLAGSTLVSGAQVPVLKEVGEEYFVDEDTPFDLSLVKHPYVMSKIHIEMIASTYAEQYGVASTVFRYGIQYGRDMAPGVVAHAFITNALAGKPLTVHGDGSQWRQYTHVEDIALGHDMLVDWLAANGDRDDRFEVLNLCGSEKVSIKDMAELVAEFTGAPIEYGPARGDDIAVKFCSPAMITKSLGWTPEISLHDGFSDAIDYYKVLNGR